MLRPTGSLGCPIVSIVTNLCVTCVFHVDWGSVGETLTAFYYSVGKVSAAGWRSLFTDTPRFLFPAQRD